MEVLAWTVLILLSALALVVGLVFSVTPALINVLAPHV
jgi:hypothetical protein